MSMTLFGRLLERRTRLMGYQATRRSFEALTEADLQDMGLKRYQLGRIARAQSLK